MIHEFNPNNPNHTALIAEDGFCLIVQRSRDGMLIALQKMEVGG